MRRWLFIVTTLIGCATPYQPMGYLGGYEDHEVNGQPGLHFVAFEGNTSTDDDVVYSYWAKRVSEVCGGKEWQMIATGDQRGIAPIRRPRVAGYIRCGPPAPLDPDVAPPR